MIKVIAEDFIKSGLIETVLPLYQELVKASQQEARCISYDLFVDEKDPGHFIFIESWPNKEALDIHCNSEHFRRIIPMIKQYTKAESKITLVNSVFDKNID
ncbi:putative quinol monooxygenase [Proteus mirabilis]|uniref:putative quinol monooxygenase n=1 Tax=Proteus mirabilis TaxID=584 RepID=UPI0021820E16|nr:putative quinol monooxygenase [Proteus mirabilis]MCT0094247.1 antibiotic biosynthesis monooxygenase [Proteus mirabilis]